MKQVIFAATIALLTMGTTAAPLLAAGAPQQGCQQGQRDCKAPAQKQVQKTPQKQVQKQPQQQGRKQASNASHAPRVGDSARNGSHFQRAANSRFKAPPKGQEYRVLNGNLVLVNSQTLAIVSVLGLLAALNK